MLTRNMFAVCLCSISRSLECWKVKTHFFFVLLLSLQLLFGVNCFFFHSLFSPHFIRFSLFFVSFICKFSSHVSSFDIILHLLLWEIIEASELLWNLKYIYLCWFWHITTISKYGKVLIFTTLRFSHSVKWFKS